MIAYFFHLKSKKEVQSTKESIELKEEVKNSNIIKDIRHVSKDMEGNEYIIEAVQGEIDLTNSEIMFLENVTATIKPIDTSHIIITSDFGKYNIQAYDSNFSKNVIINYLNNKITA